MRHSSFTHRIGAKFLAALVIIFMFSSFGGDGNTQRFRDAAMSLDKTYHTLTDEFDYWPECGIRITGSHLASLISLTDLQNMLPYPLYLSGPHTDGEWDLNNEEDFGHYNPKAIEYLAGLAKSVVSDKWFVERSKPLVDQYLYRQMHIMMVMHDVLYDEDYYSKEGREDLFNQMLRGEVYGNPNVQFFCGSLALEDGTYVYSNVCERFLHFWARRWKDGTINPFYQGLSTVFKAYYPDYTLSAFEYWLPFEEEEVFGEGDLAEMYVVIDGSDLRLRLEPSTTADTFKWGDGSNRHPKVGERFLYLGEEGDFYFIDFHGNYVWVSKKFTHLEE